MTREPVFISTTPQRKYKNKFQSQERGDSPSQNANQSIEEYGFGLATKDTSAITSVDLSKAMQGQIPPLTEFDSPPKTSVPAVLKTRILSKEEYRKRLQEELKKRLKTTSNTTESSPSSHQTAIYKKEKYFPSNFELPVERDKKEERRRKIKVPGLQIDDSNGTEGDSKDGHKQNLSLSPNPVTKLELEEARNSFEKEIGVNLEVEDDSKK